MTQLPFANRVEAGRLLAAELVTHKLQGDVIVVALPRGGLPMGLEVAKAFGAMVIVGKLGCLGSRNWRWARSRAVHFKRLTKN